MTETIIAEHHNRRQSIAAIIAPTTAHGSSAFNRSHVTYQMWHSPLFCCSPKTVIISVWCFSDAHNSITVLCLFTFDNSYAVFMSGIDHSLHKGLCIGEQLPHKQCHIALTVITHGTARWTVLSPSSTSCIMGAVTRDKQHTHPSRLQQPTGCHRKTVSPTWCD